MADKEDGRSSQAKATRVSAPSVAADGNREPGQGQDQSQGQERGQGQDQDHSQGQAGDQKRCAFVAIIGAPNAGKSTLTNALVGAKVTIVSHKVQTTRSAIRGIVTAGDAQLVFVDTPGIFAPRRRLDKAMVEAAWGGAGDGDVVAVIVDALRGIDDNVKRILSRMKDVSVPRVLLINKVDRVSDKGALLELAAKLTDEVAFDQVFMISALNNSGVEDFKAYLAQTAPLGPWHYPEDDISDVPMRQLASELTREKIYRLLHEELPYAITVETTDWKQLRNKSVRIEQTVFVERDSQKKIVLGKGGRTIKQVSSEARKELEGILECGVHLFLFVKVRDGWGDDPERYREMGLNFPKD
ncbi:MAG: GTPase Era [Alphaproteobacteria bacterium]|nr:GTPase Era [Alphaproteobacteria bacterium]